MFTQGDDQTWQHQSASFSASTRTFSPDLIGFTVQRNAARLCRVVQAMEANAAEVADAAMKIATDPSYREYDIVSDWADAQAIDTLSRFYRWTSFAGTYIG